MRGISLQTSIFSVHQHNIVETYSGVNFIARGTTCGAAGTTVRFSSHLAGKTTGASSECRSENKSLRKNELPCFVGRYEGERNHFCDVSGISKQRCKALTIQVESSLLPFRRIGGGCVSSHALLSKAYRSMFSSRPHEAKLNASSATAVIRAASQAHIPCLPKTSVRVGHSVTSTACRFSMARHAR